MKRDEAISTMKELLENCGKLDNIFMCLTPPSTSPPIQQGYQIHLRIAMDGETEECVKKITQKHSLSFEEESAGKEIVIIYKKH